MICPKHLHNHCDCAIGAHAELEALRLHFIDALARSIDEGSATILGSGPISDAIRDLAMSSQHLTEALDNDVVED